MEKEYTIILKKSGKQHVSLCLENMVVGCGRTRNEAIESVKEAILSYLDSIEEGMSIERPISFELLHEFLSEGEEEIGKEKVTPKLKVLAYG
jgi:predicted RNase H-like HicB family nuclease